MYQVVLEREWMDGRTEVKGSTRGTKEVRGRWYRKSKRKIALFAEGRVLSLQS